MATHDYNLANQDGASFRSDLNNALSAIVSNNSSSTAPATTFAHQIWVDTTANVIKQRNAANDAWVELWRIDGGFNAKTFSSNVTLNAQSDLRFADSDSSNWVAFQAPATVSSNVTWTLPSADGSADQALTTNGSGVLSWADAGGVTDNITEGNTSAEVVDTGSDGHFKVVTEGTEALRVDASQNVGIRTTPSSWGGSRNAIQFDSAGAAYVCNDAAMAVVSNHFFDGSNNKYLTAGAAASFAVNNSNIVFDIAPSGSAGATATLTRVARVDSDGLKFGSDTAAANALDDYEEGTWTPTISFNGNSVGVTYSVQDGHYTKIGNVVTLSFRVGISAKGSSTGNLRIHGQPFRPGTPAKRVSGILGEAMGSASRPCYVRTESGSSFMGVFQIGGGSVTDSNFTTFDNYGVITFQI